MSSSSAIPPTAQSVTAKGEDETMPTACISSPRETNTPNPSLNEATATSSPFFKPGNTPLLLPLDHERSNLEDLESCSLLDTGSTIYTYVDDAEKPSDVLIPPVPTHFSPAIIRFCSFTSVILSTFFLVFFVLLGAILKAIPSMLWAVWSWCQFKDPNRHRPFYKEEKERQHMKKGRLTCDIGYYAQLVGLECDETKVETEDGYILTMQHIIDRRPGATDCKSIIPPI
jgi:hypothetical protein